MNSPNAQKHVIQIVRRFGPVGGMESYVYELSLQLQKLGYRVSVICERSYVKTPQGIGVHELGEIIRRPGWFAAFRFSSRVRRWLAAHPQEAIIHSHERLGSHDITTFHGSVFAAERDKPWWKRVSLRKMMRMYQERRELEAAKCIVPNSALTKKQLIEYYPEFAHKLSEPIRPGVRIAKFREPRSISPTGGTVGFVGKEWKRKGLRIAIAAIKQLQLARPELRFIVKGVPPNILRRLMPQQGKNYSDRRSTIVNFSEFDVLLHPASVEAYGMVISEAMAAGVPVVISDVCGACTDVSSNSGVVLPVTASITEWAQAIDSQLKRDIPVPRFERDWRVVAQEYQNILNRLPSS